MTPDDLRALADALSSGTHYVESPELHETMMRAATYLRAQAEAQPVAWRCEAQISGSDHHYLATHGHWDHMAQAATNCAAAIRALGRQQ